MSTPEVVSHEDWRRALDDIRAGERSARPGGRGVEALGSVWTFLDLTPLGRQEAWEDSPPGAPQTPPYTWWRRHDEYDQTKEEQP